MELDKRLESEVEARRKAKRDGVQFGDPALITQQVRKIYGKREEHENASAGDAREASCSTRSHDCPANVRLRGVRRVSGANRDSRRRRNRNVSTILRRICGFKMGTEEAHSSWGKTLEKSSDADMEVLVNQLNYVIREIDSASNSRNDLRQNSVRKQSEGVEERSVYRCGRRAMRSAMLCITWCRTRGILRCVLVSNCAFLIELSRCSIV